MASDVTEGKMGSPVFGNLPPVGYNFLGCTGILADNSEHDK